MMFRKNTCVWLVGVLALSAAAAQAAVVTGVQTTSSYGLKNALTQWEFGADAASSRFLGRVDLAGLFTYDLNVKDVAMLSDRRVAIAHNSVAGYDPATGTGKEVSVLNLQYDGAGLLTGATIAKTMTVDDSVGANGSSGNYNFDVAPLPNGSFVVGGQNNSQIFSLTGADTWTPTLVSGMSGADEYDTVGLITPGATQFVCGEYASPPNSDRGARSGQKYDETGRIARYHGHVYANPSPPPDTLTEIAWGYGQVGEGLRTPLLANGWVTDGYAGNSYPCTVFDGTETDGAWHDGKVGEINNADGSPIDYKGVSSMDDGRVVMVWGSGYGHGNDTVFRVYTLVQDPALQPAGSIGATGEDYEAQLFGLANDGQIGGPDRGGRFAGDYMYVYIVPEPATMALFGLGCAGLAAVRRRRRS